MWDGVGSWERGVMGGGGGGWANEMTGDLLVKGRCFLCMQRASEEKECMKEC